MDPVVNQQLAESLANLITRVLNQATVPGIPGENDITAWKAALKFVSNVGNESIAGNKLFLNRVAIGADASNHALGIFGAAGHDAGFELYETSTGTNKRLQVRQEGAGVIYNATFSTGGNAQQFQVGNQPALTINSDRRVAIGEQPSFQGRLTLVEDTNVNNYVWLRHNFNGSQAYTGYVLNSFGNSWAIRMGSISANANALEVVQDVGGNNAKRLVITTAGDVGVGTESPSAKLSLGMALGKKLCVYDSGVIQSGFGTDMSGSSLDLSVFSGSPNGQGVITFGGLNTTTSVYTERMRIDNNRLMLNGEYTRNADGGVDTTFLTVLKYGTALDLGASDGRQNRWLGIDATVTAGAAINNVLRVRTYPGGTSNLPPVNVVDFRGDQSSRFYGAVGIGITNPIGSVSNGNGVQLLPQGYVHSQTSNNIAGAFCRNGSIGNVVSFVYGTGTTNGSMVGSIGVTETSTSYNTSSDYRLKDDWCAIENACERVLQLKPVNFAWKVSGVRVDGFLAHELAEVVPEAVTGEKDAVEYVEVEVEPAQYEDQIIPAELDEDGNVLVEERTQPVLVKPAVVETQEKPVYQGIDQAKLVPLLTAALQEAIERLQVAHDRIDELEQRIIVLEDR